MYSNTISHSHPQHLLAAHQEQQHRQQQLQERMRQETTRLAVILVREFGAQTVSAFGPLTYNRFTEGMPLELAVEGMPAQEIARAAAHLKQISALQVEHAILGEALAVVLTKWNIYFDYIWGTECSSPRHQKFLQIIASKDSRFSEYRFPEYEDELKDLIRKEILKIEDGAIMFTMPIIKEWMKRNKHIL